MSKFLEAWVDIETTGDDGSRHALIEFSALVFRDNHLINEINRTFRPLPGDKMKKAALEATGHTTESLMELEEPRKSFSRLKGDLNRLVDPFDGYDKMFFYAYNAQFDFGFMHSWCREKMQFPYMGSYFWWPPVDVASIVIDIIPECRHELKSFKLIDIVGYLGIEVDESKLHTASYDIYLTREVYKVVKGLQ